MENKDYGGDDDDQDTSYLKMRSFIIPQNWTNIHQLQQGLIRSFKHYNCKQV